MIWNYSVYWLQNTCCGSLGPGWKHCQGPEGKERSREASAGKESSHYWSIIETLITRKRKSNDNNQEVQEARTWRSQHYLSKLMAVHFEGEVYLHYDSDWNVYRCQSQAAAPVLKKKQLQKNLASSRKECCF